MSSTDEQQAIGAQRWAPYARHLQKATGAHRAIVLQLAQARDSDARAHFGLRGDVVADDLALSKRQVHAAAVVGGRLDGHAEHVDALCAVGLGHGIEDRGRGGDGAAWEKAVGDATVTHGQQPHSTEHAGSCMARRQQCSLGRQGGLIRGAVVRGAEVVGGADNKLIFDVAHPFGLADLEDALQQRGQGR